MCGLVVVSFLILDNWHYWTFWYIFGLTNAIPALLELGFVGVLVFKHNV